MVNVKTPAPDTGEENSVVGSIAHAREILLCLAKGVNSLSDIARECGFSKSTVHRLLKSLEQFKCAVEDPFDRRYYLGPMMRKLMSDPVTPHHQLINCAEDEMRKLACLTEETVTLDVMPGIQYVPLYEIPSIHHLRVSSDFKKNRPMFFSSYAGGIVKALLSQLDNDKLEIVLANTNILPETERTVTDKEYLMAQLKEIRQKGYAVTRGERKAGVMCLSAPITTYYVPVALSVVGPETRISPNLKSMVTKLKESADRIAIQIAKAIDH